MDDDQKQQYPIRGTIDRPLPVMERLYKKHMTKFKPMEKLPDPTPSDASSGPVDPQEA